MRTAIENLDSVVGEALGLTNKDVSCLQEDLATDAFLRGIRPQYPGTVTRKMGFREGLDATDRYDA
ncbi:hypothetical protein EDE15_3245 [Edaphobacter aggregans]|uniref:Uncharacterized protein n=1 Tax=Edaphobacter aggregans TaxID=570835 RepID=A0A428MLF6_9BACT|nr:hypothetical protein [Edaphobacter aggregans]RSL17707.1 hypothetical protein EDE15_3245 [Edaphobacter aggregans]